MTEQDSCYPTCRHIKATLVRAIDHTPEGVAIAPAEDASDSSLLSSRSAAEESASLLSSRSAAEGSASPAVEPASQPASNDELTGNPNQ
jgi:hypothetical protein